MARINPFESLREPGFTRKLTIAFLAVTLVVTTTIPVAFFAFGKIRQASERASASSRTLEKVGEFQRDIGRMRVKARDLANSHSRSDANDLATVLNEMTDQVRCIRGQTSCAGASSFDSLPPRESASWNAMIDNVSNINTQFRSDQNIENFDNRMLTEVETPAEHLARQVRERGRLAHRQITVAIIESTAILMLVLAAALLVAGALAYWVPRSMMHKLDELRHVAHMIAHGDLTARIDTTRVGSDEVGDLVNDFNSMAKSLENREDENRTLQQQLQMALMSEQERATRDPLTSLRNHRYFQDSLRAELERCGRSNSNVTIAVIDLDNFKQVNDRFGHHEGDAVLLRATKGISDNLRPYDLACRLGGEEFGVIFPETDPPDAKVVLERIAEHILNFGPQNERLTFSAGLATFPVHSTTQAELYQRADEASYTAKMNGKNQVVIYDPESVVRMDSEEHKRHRSREAVLTTATTLVSAVDQKDPYTRNHSELTAIYAATIARALNLEEEQVKLVYRAGLLHDVGKIGVADAILRKPGRLESDEWAQIKMHPEFSYRILQTAEMEPIATWVRHHHEHWNGSGYPFGLEGEDIPLGSRIVLVADAFEAMTSDRVYRRALSTRQAVEELSSNSGGQFDPHIVDVMIELVASGVFDQVRSQYGRDVNASDNARVIEFVTERRALLAAERAHGPAFGAPLQHHPQQHEMRQQPYPPRQLPHPEDPTQYDQPAAMYHQQPDPFEHPAAHFQPPQPPAVPLMHQMPQGMPQQPHPLTDPTMQAHADAEPGHHFAAESEQHPGYPDDPSQAA